MGNSIQIWHPRGESTWNNFSERGLSLEGDNPLEGKLLYCRISTSSTEFIQKIAQISTSSTEFIQKKMHKFRQTNNSITLQFYSFHQWSGNLSTCTINMQLHASSIFVSLGIGTMMAAWCQILPRCLSLLTRMTSPMAAWRYKLYWRWFVIGRGLMLKEPTLFHTFCDQYYFSTCQKNGFHSLRNLNYKINSMTFEHWSHSYGNMWLPLI